LRPCGKGRRGIEAVRTSVRWVEAMRTREKGVEAVQTRGKGDQIILRKRLFWTDPDIQPFF